MKKHTSEWKSQTWDPYDYRTNHPAANKESYSTTTSQLGRVFSPGTGQTVTYHNDTYTAPVYKQTFEIDTYSKSRDVPYIAPPYTITTKQRVEGLTKKDYLNLKNYSSPRDIERRGPFKSGKLYTLNDLYAEVCLFAKDTAHHNGQSRGVNIASFNTKLVNGRNQLDFGDTIRRVTVDDVLLCVGTEATDQILETAVRDGVVKTLGRIWCTTFLFDQKYWTFCWRENELAGSPESFSERWFSYSAGSLKEFTKVVSSSSEKMNLDVSP